MFVLGQYMVEILSALSTLPETGQKYFSILLFHSQMENLRARHLPKVLLLSMRFLCHFTLALPKHLKRPSL